MRKRGVNLWEDIYIDLRRIREDIKEAMMSAEGVEDWSACGDVWEELADQMQLMDKYHGEDSDTFVAELVRQAMIEEAIAEREDKYV